MIKIFAIIAIVAGFCLLLISALFDWTSSGVDKAILSLLVFSCISVYFWHWLIEKTTVSKTHDEIADQTLALMGSVFSVLLLVPIFTYITGLNWLPISIFGMALIVTSQVVTFVRILFYFKSEKIDPTNN